MAETTAAPTPPGQMVAGLTKKAKYEQLHASLDLDRSSFITHWRDLNDYILPRRGRFQVTDANRGERRNLKIIDSTATFAARTLSSGMMSGITSPARPWKRLSVPDPELAEFASVKAWLHTVNQRMDTVFLRSNLYNVLPTIYQDMGVFATSAMIVEEDNEDVIRCYAFPIGSYYLANDRKLKVRTFLRNFRMTVRQLVEEFGYENLSLAAQSMWAQNQGEAWIEVVHVVQPNFDYDPRNLETKFKPFTDCYYERGATAGATREIDNATLLRERGFDEYPILAPRWAITGEDVYGTDCPGMITLGDVKSLQTMRKRGAQALEKMINPPMVAPPEMRTVKASILPGDINYSGASKENGFRAAHETKVNLNDLRVDQNEVRTLIRRGFYEDLFLMLAYADQGRGTQPVTAAEIAARQEEKLLALGPVLEQLNQDLLDPLIQRTFAIMVRRGYVPEPPKELEGVPLKIEYISIMAQAQKAVGIAGVERFIGVVGEMAKIDPSVLDKVDRDEVVDAYADMTGIPPRLIVPDDKVQEIRAQRAKTQAAAQATALAEQASKAAKNLSQADTGGRNALTDVIGGANGQAA